MTRQGLVIDSQTLWDQIYALGQLLEPTYHTLHRHVLSDSWVSADETTWQLMRHKFTPANVKTGEWYVWIAHREDAAFYLIRSTRDDIAALELMTVPELDPAGMPKLGEDDKPIGKLYQGKVMCDGWWAYKYIAEHLGGWILVHCWAHVRREFVACEAGFAKEAKEMLSLIGELYGIEKKIPAGAEHDEERRAARQEESRAVLEKIEEWVWKNGLQAPAQSALRKACVYLSNRWVGLSQFLDDPRLPLDNNGTERDCRQAVTGKKNHYGSRSERGLRTAGILYTLVESARLSGVEPKTYLKLAAVRARRGWPVMLPHEVTEQELVETLGLSEAEARRALSQRPKKGLG